MTTGAGGLEGVDGLRDATGAEDAATPGSEAAVSGACGLGEVAGSGSCTWSGASNGAFCLITAAHSAVSFFIAFWALVLLQNPIVLSVARAVCLATSYWPSLSAMS